MDIKVKDLIALLTRVDGEIKVRINNGKDVISGIHVYNRKLYIDTSNNENDSISIKIEVRMTNIYDNSVELFDGLN